MTRPQQLPDLQLRFPIEDVPKWAGGYSYADDAAVEEIGRSARARGWYSRKEFLAVTLWKTPRQRSRCRKNSEEAVRDATELALRSSDERLRIGVLTMLQGVEMPTASVLLHLAHRDPYPILDFRALWSLGLDKQPSYYSFEFWQAYTITCRGLAQTAGVSMRDFDRALWQYSKVHQPPPSGLASPTASAPGNAAPPRMNKSAEMRALFEAGRTVSQVATALNVSYAFAHGVRKRWLQGR